MIKANTEDRELIINVLTESFVNNKSVNLIVKQGPQKIQHIRALMAYSFDMCSESGEVFLSDERSACALILYPHLKRLSLYNVWLDIRLIFTAIGFNGLFKAMKREKRIKEIQPKLPLAYLWFIGVSSSAQHRGIGSKLLQEIIEMAHSKKLGVYLETSTLENLPWYKQFGFEVYNQLNFCYTLYFLKR